MCSHYLRRRTLPSTSRSVSHLTQEQEGIGGGAGGGGGEGGTNNPHSFFSKIDAQFLDFLSRPSGHSGHEREKPLPTTLNAFDSFTASFKKSIIVKIVIIRNEDEDEDEDDDDDDDDDDDAAHANDIFIVFLLFLLSRVVLLLRLIDIYIYIYIMYLKLSESCL